MQMKILSQSKGCKPRSAGGHAYVLIERIAKPLRYCRIMHMKHRNDLPWRASQGEPRHGRRVSMVSSSIEAQKA